MADYDDNVNRYYDESREIEVKDNRIEAQKITGKLKAVILTTKSNKAQKEKLKINTALSQLDDIHWQFVEEALVFSEAKEEFEALKLHLTGRNQHMESYANAPKLADPDEQNKRDKNYASKRE